MFIGAKNCTLQTVILNPKNSVAVVSAYDERINISEEKKAGRVLYDKKKELSKTILTSKARAIDNSNNSITDNPENLNPDVTEHEENTFYQESDDTDDEILIAGYTPPQVLDKLTELNEKIYKNEKISAKEKDNIIAKIHILEDAMDVAGSPYKYTNDKQRQDIMLNAYFVMNNQEIKNHLTKLKKNNYTLV